jgi:hypothetical protein
MVIKARLITALHDCAIGSMTTRHATNSYWESILSILENTSLPPPTTPPTKRRGRQVQAQFGVVAWGMGRDG